MISSFVFSLQDLIFTYIFFILKIISFKKNQPYCLCDKYITFFYLANQLSSYDYELSSVTFSYKYEAYIYNVQNSYICVCMLTQLPDFLSYIHEFVSLFLKQYEIYLYIVAF